MEKFKYVYGPVPSRRMGLSLGISPIKEGHCNYSCIYCQLGRTRKMTNTVESYFDYKEIVEEFKTYLNEELECDVITIVGEGEPLLYKDLDLLIAEIKKLTDRPIALITNAALLMDEEVREAIKAVDILLPSLDAYNEDLFKKINRPHGSISFREHIKSLKEFSKEFKGQLWIETMIMDGINDSDEFFYELKDLLEEINYHRIYINTPVRPPAEDYVKEASQEAIDSAIEILSAISIDKLVSEGFYSHIKDDYEAVLNITKRHPMNQFEIDSFIAKRGNDDKDNFFKRLNNDDRVEVINYKNYLTYRIK